MGRPATTLLRAEAVHTGLRQEGVAVGARIPRPLFDQLLVRLLRVGSVQAREIVRTGEAAGLWRREGHHGSQAGGIVLLEPVHVAVLQQAVAVAQE